MRSKSVLAALLTIASAYPPGAPAWGGLGHRTMGAIADRLLGPATRDTQEPTFEPQAFELEADELLSRERTHRLHPLTGAARRASGALSEDPRRAMARRYRGRRRQR